MKSISRRIRKLEERLGPPVETEYTRRVRERLEAAQRRLAQLQERCELGPPQTGPLVETRHRRFSEAMARIEERKKRRNNFR
jgi:hypothetical protein